MAIELHLQKTTKTPWGFRLAGGVEYEVPLTVIKVAENSIAENAGMQEGDVVVRLNDIPMAALTHVQAHDVLSSAGDDFILAVRRGDLAHLPPRLLLYDTSVDNAEDHKDVHTALNIKNEEENNDKDLNITDEEIASIIGEQLHVSSQKAVEQNVEISEEVTTTRVQSEVSKVIMSEALEKSDEKKWSTFLQKPKNPKPKPVQKEPEGPKAAPYRVIIKKQPKKDQGSCKKSNQEEHENKTVIESEESLTQEPEQSIDVNTENLEISESPSRELDENQNDVVDEIVVGNQDDTEKEFDEKCSENEDRNKHSDTDDIPDESEAGMALLSEKRLSINLEEQLAQVQRQLLALSQLPSAIQQTLNAVTQQLSELVSVKQAQEQEITIEAKATIEEEITEEYLDLSEEREERALSVLEEESYEHFEEDTREVEVKDEAMESLRNESEDEQALFEALEKQIEEEERRKEEELEARRIEQEKIQKRDKERRSSQPLTPLERPIILPGGRKWCQPDDASKSRRRPSATDERIANTINTFSEVIVGRTMGINFLKFQPPPKNLDYLQKSAVYRLVHDIEPPAKGVIARDVKVLAEQDYYTEKEEDLTP